MTRNPAGGDAMHAMVKLMIGMWRLPLAVRIWLGGLMAVNVLAQTEESP
jgi:hypothetical protein